jgi:hypothetical protein
MLEFNNKFVTFLVNILLCVWQITQVIPALILLAVFHNCEVYRNEDANVTVLTVNKGWFNGGACFSLGPVIFVTPDCENEICKHETGHSVQSLIFGPLFHFIVSIPSVILFCIRRAKNKDAKWYHSHFPEGGYKLTADHLGHVDTSKLL